MIKVSFGNLKLPTDTMIFNIPAKVTCPGRTELCAKACYALKAERLYKAVLPAGEHNFRLTRDNAFIVYVSDTIEKYRHKIKRIRVHEAGDFYSQAYLDKWFLIARLHPKIKFYAYTKSFHLDFSACPDNFWLIGSFDKTSTDKAREFFEKQKRFFKNTFSIVDRGQPAKCIEDCSICNACWTGKGKQITVEQH